MNLIEVLSDYSLNSDEIEGALHSLCTTPIIFIPPLQTKPLPVGGEVDPAVQVGAQEGVDRDD